MKPKGRLVLTLRSNNAEGVTVPEAAALTPKALANVSPGLKRSDNPGIRIHKKGQTLKGFANCRTLSGLNRSLCVAYPGFSLRSNPGLKLANAFGVTG
jgi:hypothetical protein